MFETGFKFTIFKKRAIFTHFVIVNNDFSFINTFSTFFINNFLSHLLTTHQR